MRRKLPQLRQALEWRVLAHHRLLLRQLLAHIDFLDREIASLADEIAARVTQKRARPSGAIRT